MKELYKSRYGYLTAGLLTSIGLLGGLVMTIVGVVTHNFAVMGVGLGMLVICFYACPFCWIAFGTCVGNYHLYLQITEGNVRTVKELAQLNNVSEDAIRRKLTSLARKNVIAKNAVEGFYKKSDPAFYVERAVSCPSCGATSSVSGAKPNCPYCGRRLV